MNSEDLNTIAGRYGMHERERIALYDPKVGVELEDMDLLKPACTKSSLAEALAYSSIINGNSLYLSNNKQ